MATTAVADAASHRRRAAVRETALGVLGAISLCHCLNDLMQSVVPAVYPILKDSYALDFGQIGLITFANQATASMLQPVVGYFTDKAPKPYSLAIGMGFTLAGLVLLAFAPSFLVVLVAAALRRHRLVDLPSRVVAGGPHGLGRPPRVRAVALPGRRQRRARRWGRCWRPSSCCRTASAASPGSRSPRSSA